MERNVSVILLVITRALYSITLLFADTTLEIRAENNIYTLCIILSPIIIICLPSSCTSFLKTYSLTSYNILPHDLSIFDSVL